MRGSRYLGRFPSVCMCVCVCVCVCFCVAVVVQRLCLSSICMQYLLSRSNTYDEQLLKFQVESYIVMQLNLSLDLMFILNFHNACDRLSKMAIRNFI